MGISKVNRHDLRADRVALNGYQYRFTLRHINSGFYYDLLNRKTP